MKNNFFAGDFTKLKNHWSDLSRAEKFLRGGTRAEVVNKVIEINLNLLMNSNWLDLGTGAGYIQSVINQKHGHLPNQLGLDWSFAMLSINEVSLHKIQGTYENIPIRKASINLITFFFTLSDYPSLESILENAGNKLDQSGSLIIVDYSIGDEYWETRNKYHNQIGNDNNKIIGNINLRDIHYFQKILPTNLLTEQSKIIRYEVRSIEMQSNFELPEKITRCFFYLKLKKTT
ncbi:MAG: class I SAM-dependent methyltransferase [Candidatus Heimdallarchaeota archaeon]|nr:class I SAM-dependent methyltransferase [Candidatus Heimdallarchaeota archaeon]MDH5644699.1 class I SAM-dependent methyltransferase [Candidatus Heimdallarchaeota archaeon]